jgi:integrase
MHKTLPREVYIHIKKTKNGHERLVPLCESLKEVLEQYVGYRNMMPLKDIAVPEALLFIKMDGTPCKAANVYTWFKRVLRECEIAHIGNHHGPRVHDLRHSFAVHALEQMARNGMDLYTSLPIISTCLGHRSLSATEEYVRLTSEMYPELGQMSSPINAFIYPKIRKGVPYED